MKKYFLAFLFILFFLFQNVTHAQCPDGALSAPTLDAGTQVRIGDIDEYDKNYANRTDYIGDLITLTTKATLDDDCWYDGSFDLNGAKQWFHYFRLYPADWVYHDPAVDVVPQTQPVVNAPTTFGQAEVEAFMSMAYRAFVDSFESIKGEYDMGGWNSTLNFPGATYTYISIDGLHASIGTYTTIHDGFVAMQNLQIALKAAHIYPSDYSDESYHLADMGAVVEDPTATFYTDVALLMKGTDAFNSTYANENVQINILLQKEMFGVGPNYELTFEFLDKRKMY